MYLKVDKLTHTQSVIRGESTLNEFIDYLKDNYKEDTKIRFDADIGSPLGSDNFNVYIKR